MKKGNRWKRAFEELGVRSGCTLLVFSHIKSGPDAETKALEVLETLRDVIGPQGTILAPTFTLTAIAMQEDPLVPLPLWLASYYKASPREPAIFRVRHTPADVQVVGYLPELLRNLPGAKRSNHPVYSFTAWGPYAKLLTQSSPFHFPLGSNSPLARLYSLNGELLLMNVDHEVNSLLHLAEVWAEAPYIQRSLHIKVGENRWRNIRGVPTCSRGFNKIAPILHQARLVHYTKVEDITLQRMNVRALVSMAVTLLRGAPDALLCNEPDCPWCQNARKWTQPSQPLPRPARLNPL